jgi:hypothetical protein
MRLFYDCNSTFFSKQLLFNTIWFDFIRAIYVLKKTKKSQNELKFSFSTNRSTQDSNKIRICRHCLLILTKYYTASFFGL